VDGGDRVGRRQRRTAPRRQRDRDLSRWRHLCAPDACGGEGGPTGRRRWTLLARLPLPWGVAFLAFKSHLTLLSNESRGSAGGALGEWIGGGTCSASVVTAELGWRTGVSRSATKVHGGDVVSPPRRSPIDVASVLPRSCRSLPFLDVQELKATSWLQASQGPKVLW
jgi:hypothetical protein